MGRLRSLIDTLSPREQDRLLQLLQTPERMDYEPADILLRRSARKIDRRLHSVAKEPWTVKWIEGFEPGDVFYDVGANVGAYSLLAAKASGGAVAVVAFEPSAPSYHDLCVNVGLNDCDEIVTPLPIALWSETTLIPFVHLSLEPGSSNHSFDPSEHGGELRQRQPAMTLDDCIGLFDLPPPTHLKLDTEGCDEHVLRGAQSTLSRTGCRSVLVELDADEPAGALEELLLPHGFALVDSYGVGKPGRCTYNHYVRG